MIKLGFIGAGNMAEAITKGVLTSGFLSPQSIILYDVDERRRETMHLRYGVKVERDNVDVVASADVVVLAIKPVFLKQVLVEIKPYVGGKKIVSIAAGWTTEMLSGVLDKDSGAQILRVMPNTPALVGEGFTALSRENSFDSDTFAWVERLFQTLGQTEVVSEQLFDAVIAASGSSPAYVFLFIEAMADGAVKLGMPRSMAYRAAAQSVLGAAKMVLESGEHPGKLKDDVCSPGGTTIEAVHALEQGGFRAAVLSAMDACALRNRLMAEQAREVKS